MIAMHFVGRFYEDVRSMCRELDFQGYEADDEETTAHAKVVGMLMDWELLKGKGAAVDQRYVALVVAFAACCRFVEGFYLPDLLIRLIWRDGKLESEACSPALADLMKSNPKATLVDVLMKGDEPAPTPRSVDPSVN